MTISDGFKKLTLAAIGAGAITYEKTSEILGHLVEKGEITVDEGKIINSELKHNVKESVTNQKEIVKEAAQKVKEEAEEKHAMRDENTAKTIDQAAVEAVDEAAKAAKDVIDFVSKLWRCLSINDTFCRVKSSYGLNILTGIRQHNKIICTSGGSHQRRCVVRSYICGHNLNAAR